MSAISSVISQSRTLACAAVIAAAAQAAALDDTTGFRELRIGYETGTRTYHASMDVGQSNAQQDGMFDAVHRVRAETVIGRERPGMDLAFGLAFAGERSDDRTGGNRTTYQTWSLRATGGPWWKLSEDARFEVLPFLGYGIATLGRPDVGTANSNGSLLEVGATANLMFRIDGPLHAGLTAGVINGRSSHLQQDTVGTSVRTEITRTAVTGGVLLGWDF